MRRARRSAAALVVAWFCSAASIAAGQDGSARDEAARAAFRDGAEAFESGSYRIALDNFQRAYELSGRPELLFNIGLAHDRLRQDELAVQSFEEYLGEVPDAANRAEVEGRIGELRRAADERDRERARLETESDGGVLGQWWFWTIAGAVIVGGVIAVVLLTRDGRQEPLLGTTGQVSTALVTW